MRDMLILAALGAIGGALWRAYGMVKAWLKRQFTVEYELRDRAPFNWTAEHLAKDAAKRPCRKLTVHERDADDYDSDDTPSDPLASRATFVPGVGSHLIWYEARPIWVERVLKEGDFSKLLGSSHREESFVLRTIGRDQDFLKRFVLEIERDYRESRHDSLSMWYGDGYGNWMERQRHSGRAMESVVLAGNQAATILADMDTFFDTRDRYERVGVPWRRGYLLHGPPGCGKSSLAMALATESGLNLYMLSISQIRDDDGLQEAMRNVKPNSIVVLEDIDTVFTKRTPGDGGSKLTFSGLLNVIDGAAATEGRILIMTTNHPEKLDPALIRPGRADVHVELGPADADVAARMFMRFYPEANGLSLDFGRRAVGSTQAKIQVHLLAHWDDPVAAVDSWEVPT